MRILAIDPATKTGWKSPTASGVEDFKLRSNESKGMKMVKFRAFFKSVIVNDEIDIVVYEKPSGRHFNALRSHSNFEGVLMQLCEELEVQYKDYSPGEIKRHATGKGNANKAIMYATACEVFDTDVVDDNHADALFLYELAKSQLT